MAALVASMNNVNFCGNMTGFHIAILLSGIMGIFTFAYILIKSDEANIKDCDVIFLLFILILLLPLGIMTFPLCFIHFLIQKARGY